MLLLQRLDVRQKRRFFVGQAFLHHGLKQAVEGAAHRRTGGHAVLYQIAAIDRMLNEKED